MHVWEKKMSFTKIVTVMPEVCISFFKHVIYKSCPFLIHGWQLHGYMPLLLHDIYSYS